MSSLISITINDRPVSVRSTATGLQACDSVGVDVPRFGYHERLSVAGNCRICLVEVQKSPKPVVACARPVSPNIVIYTNTPLVRKAREAVLEFLLLNHPLDCPICDQGGECDLQEEARAFGSDRGRNFDGKRSVEDKECGPVIKTIRTRCIHCTRCVRFGIEISGTYSLGTLNRGTNTEIGNYITKISNSPILSNVVDLCPVGALTLKTSAFVARPWELKSLETVDLTDGLGSNIYINYKELDVVKVSQKKK
jgi:NADH dehydrogenase (ubiquinone) Fe-S protein 1